VKKNSLTVENGGADDTCADSVPSDLSLDVGKFLQDTAHLDAFRTGAYLLLLLRYWLQGPLRDDWSELAATAKMSPDLWKSANVSLMKLFRKGSDGYWHHDALEAQRKRALEKQAAFKSRATNAARSRWSGKKVRAARSA
jgi:uncharacterized protein YdaU (DUF1376 family)